MEHKTARNMRITASIGILISLLIYLLFGCIGYILYGSLEENKFLDYLDDSSKNLFLLENISYLINVISCFPICFLSFKNYLIYMISLIASELIRKKNVHLKDKVFFL